MDFDFYNWNSNLFAYLYQHYESSELVDELPCHMRYVVSESFHQRIGECQIRVNSILRRYLRAIFVKNYLVACRSVSTFSAYTQRSCLKLSRKFVPQISFLCFCAVVSELNLYCFRRGCYRYALYAPECLQSILQKCDYVALSISDRPDGCSTAEGFDKLLECCENILNDSATAPSSNCEEIVKFGKNYFIRELERYQRKNRFINLRMGDVQEENESSDSEEEDSENENTCEGPPGNKTKCEISLPEDDIFVQEDHDANLLAAVKPFDSKACHICHEENCQRYLEEFVKRFSSGEMKYAPPTTQ